MTVEINSLEEMCGMMCDNRLHTPKEETWIFTFGSDHKNAGHFVKISGDFRTARKKMCEVYGDKWAFQYSEDEWEKWAEDAISIGCRIETEIPFEEG